MIQLKELLDEMKDFFYRIRMSFGTIAKTACKWASSLFAVAGLISLFVPFEGIFREDTSFGLRLVIAVAIVICVWCICAFIKAIIVGFQTKKKVLNGQNGMAVFVLY